MLITNHYPIPLRLRVLRVCALKLPFRYLPIAPP